MDSAPLRRGAPSTRCGATRSRSSRATCCSPARRRPWPGLGPDAVRIQAATFERLCLGQAPRDRRTASRRRPGRALPAGPRRQDRVARRDIRPVRCDVRRLPPRRGPHGHRLRREDRRRVPGLRRRRHRPHVRRRRHRQDPRHRPARARPDDARAAALRNAAAPDASPEDVALVAQARREPVGGRPPWRRPSLAFCTPGGQGDPVAGRLCRAGPSPSRCPCPTVPCRTRSSRSPTRWWTARPEPRRRVPRPRRLRRRSPAGPSGET